MRLAVMRRPGGLGHPASRQRLVVRGRLMARGHPGAQHRLVHDARRLALQPVVPPAQHLLQEADLRAGLGEVRIGMRPRPDQALARHVEMFQQARDGVGVAVGPAADGEDRTFDRAEILAHRAVPPVGVAPLVLQPALEEQRHALQPLQPHLAPALADQQRIGRMAHVGEEEAAPAEVGRGELGAAHVVHVVGVAIVGRAQRHDGLERRRLQGRDLQGVEAAPGDAEHADRAAAPRLAGEPGDHLQRIVELGLAVFVDKHALGFAAAADVDTHRGVAVAREVRMGQRIALMRAVALAVGQILQQRGHRVGVGVLGQPDAGGEPRAVLQRDRRVLDLADRAGKGRDDQDGRSGGIEPDRIVEAFQPVLPRRTLGQIGADAAADILGDQDLAGFGGCPGCARRCSRPCRWR